MGMFDYVNCKMPLPDGFVQPDVTYFQTKGTQVESWQCGLDLYTLNEDGSIMVQYMEYPGSIHGQMVPAKLDETITYLYFYGDHNLDINGMNTGYVAEIVNGKINKIRLRETHEII